MVGGVDGVDPVMYLLSVSAAQQPWLTRLIRYRRRGMRVAPHDGLLYSACSGPA